MIRLPKLLRGLLDEFQSEFSSSVWERFLGMLFALVMMRGRRTVWRLAQLAGAWSSGHFSSYHRVLSHRVWSGKALAKLLAIRVVTALAPEGTLELAGDETVTQHRGDKVFGKGCHRDAVRSSHNFTAYRWGHRWVVLALRVRVSGTSRAWALPMLVALYRNPDDSKKAGVKHRTPVELMMGLLRIWRRWFPDRKCSFSGDGSYTSHALAAFARRHDIALVSKFPAAAVLHQKPPTPKKGQKGRPRIIGKRLLSPEQVIANAQRRKRHEVDWYGGRRREVSVVSAVGNWYRQGQGLVPIRWVHVRDLTGSHREEYFFTTDLEMTVPAIIETFVGRWDIEVTFEELREHLGLETTRGRCKNTILRAEPCIFLAYTLVAYWFTQLPKKQRGTIFVRWQGKTSITFADAMAAVRRSAWDQHLFQHPLQMPLVEKIPPKFKNQILDALTLVT